MPSDSEPSSHGSFIDIARQRDMLSSEQAVSLAQIADGSSVSVGRHAIEEGMLQPIDVEIVEALAAPKDLAPGYELVDVLGYGALGVVYRARQPHLHRDVAIKAILQSRVDQQNVLARFQQEGALIGRLQHPNIVSAYDFGSNRDRLYLVMELVNGSDLSKRLDAGPIPTATALSIVRQTAAGLAHAHSHEIIHRDIKPGNLLLTQAPAGFDLPPDVPLVKIADFGLARFNRAAELDQQDTRLTMTGSAIGTPMYCAPEQLSGDEIDHRADIYALGASLFRMLTGETPFESDRVSKLIAAKVTGQPPRFELLPKGIDPAVTELMSGMMRSDPDDRVADYESLIASIDAITGRTDNAKRLNPVATRGSLVPNAEAIATMEAPKRLGYRNRKLYRILLPALVSLGIVLGGILIARTLQPPAEANWVRGGWESHLFDGRTMTGWNVRSGLWQSDVDSEGGAVLVGSGSATCKLALPPETNAGGASAGDASAGGDPAGSGVGMKIGVDLRDAEWAEIQFGFGGDPIDQNSRLVVRVGPEVVQLGSKRDANAEFEPLDESIELPPRVSEPPRYHEVTIERHGGTWFAYFDDVTIGNTLALPDNDETELLLVAKGTVHFEGPLLYQLRAPAVLQD